LVAILLMSEDALLVDDAHNKWLNQICSDNNVPPADLWRHAIN